ncbi:MAG: ATP-binding protein [Nitrospirota bacterium]
MNDFLKELRTLNNNLQKLIDHLVPSIDASVFDTFKAFRVSSQNNRLFIRGIREHDPVRFQELKGIDQVISALIENTEQFLYSLPCNNVLLYGPRGTGKSSAIKALLNKYGRKGLRMIEMPRDTLFNIIEVADVIKDRPDKFIIFCDDLSFEEDEKSYRQLKAVLEGGVEIRPGNMLIYATSNRRHLMPEKTDDNLPGYSGGELHPAETIEEKLSLSDRFGLRLGLPHFDMDTYLEIVDNYIMLRKIRINREELKRNALRWSLSHGSYSGRTARQFVDDLEGHLRRKKPVLP